MRRPAVRTRKPQYHTTESCTIKYSVIFVHRQLRRVVLLTSPFHKINYTHGKRVFSKKNLLLLEENYYFMLFRFVCIVLNCYGLFKTFVSRHLSLRWWINSKNTIIIFNKESLGRNTFISNKFFLFLFFFFHNNIIMILNCLVSALL